MRLPRAVLINRTEASASATPSRRDAERREENRAAVNPAPLQPTLAEGKIIPEHLTRGGERVSARVFEVALITALPCARSSLISHFYVNFTGKNRGQKERGEAEGEREREPGKGCKLLQPVCRRRADVHLQTAAAKGGVRARVAGEGGKEANVRHAR